MTNADTSRRLQKSSTDRIIDGICGGVAEYLQVDSTLVRVGWVLLGLAGGVGLVLYLTAMLIMPSPDPSRVSANAVSRSKMGGYLIGGVLMVVIGFLWFLQTTGIFSLHSLTWFSWKTVFPVVLIVVGVILILKRSRQVLPGSDPNDSLLQEEPVVQIPGVRRFYRSRREKKLFGVCGGLGDYFGLDPVFVRILFLALAFVSFGFVIVAYLLLSIFFPEEPMALAV